MFSVPAGLHFVLHIPFYADQGAAAPAAEALARLVGTNPIGHLFNDC
jgi:hypothetical protein